MPHILFVAGENDRSEPGASRMNHEIYASHASLLAALRNAENAIVDGNARNLSDRTMAKRFKALFAAEDACKRAGVC
jgi:hypothetical protein